MTEPTTIVTIRGTKYQLTEAQLERRLDRGEITVTEWSEAQRALRARPLAASTAAPPDPVDELARLRKLSPAEQRKVATEDWPAVSRALSGKLDPNVPLTSEERKDIAGTLRAHPELAGVPERWAEIQAVMKPKENE